VLIMATTLVPPACASQPLAHALHSTKIIMALRYPPACESQPLAHALHSTNIIPVIVFLKALEHLLMDLGEFSSVTSQLHIGVLTSLKRSSYCLLYSLAWRCLLTDTPCRVGTLHSLQIGN
jgi:hypothetical protein